LQLDNEIHLERNLLRKNILNLILCRNGISQSIGNSQGKEYYDYYANVGVEPDRKIGDSSIGYSKNFNQEVVGIVGEIPYIYDNKIEDNNLTKKARRENVINEMVELEKLKIFVSNIISTADLNKNSIFYDLFQYLIVRWEKDLYTKKNI
jgi:hypothetical protein